MKTLLIILAFISADTLAGAVKSTGSPESISAEITGIQSPDTSGRGSLRIRPFNLEIVPPSSGVQFYRNGIIFLSYSKLQEKVPERHVSFGSIRTYTSSISDTTPGDYEAFTLNGNAPFPSEATTFTADFNTMYLSLIPENETREKIFKAQYSSSGWKIDDKPLEFCNGDFIYSHPALSADGAMMVFSSDMAGSAGGLDLWVSRKEGGSWSRPVNLGPQINTVGNELFASLDHYSNLFFSSDGRSGKGGYDIFVAGFNGSGWDKAGSLPEVINTGDDELAFTLNNASDNNAFFTRRIHSGKTRTQLYIVDFKNEPPQKGTRSLSDHFMALTGRKFNPSGGQARSTQLMADQKDETVQASPVQVSPVPPVEEEVKPPAGNDKPAGQQETRQVPVSAAGTVGAAPKPEVTRDEIVYRVQILANSRPVGSQNITIAGKTYKSFEYLYKGGYRTTVGEFRTLTEAMRLQTTCRQNGYGQAFVVAFKNNIRSTDPELFK
jgi:hypothetical protein